MSESDNPFDQTIWDPAHPEHAIEDPLHGPSAVHDMLEVPSMPLGDGTYYQPGAYYAVGTPLFDAKGDPIYRIGTARSTSAVTREALEVDEWIDASRQGEEALTALEAKRQQERLERTGLAHSFKPSDVCAGGQRLEDCDTARSMVGAAQEHASRSRDEALGEGPLWNTLAWLSKSCGTCALSCEVAIQTRDGKPTGITRFTNTRPRAADVQEITLPGYDEVQGDRVSYRGLREVADTTGDSTFRIVRGDDLFENVEYDVRELPPE